MRGLNWTKRGFAYSLTGENQSRSLSDLSEPKKMFEPENASAGKNQNKSLRDLNWTDKDLEKNQNKSLRGLKWTRESVCGKESE